MTALALWLLRSLFRGVMHVYPPDFRRRYGQEMERFFLDELAGTEGAGRVAVGLRSCGRTGAAGVRERWDRIRANNRGGGGMGGWAMEVRLAVRSLLRRPGFALAATLTIGLGIGAATAVFSVVDAVVLRPLPYPAAGRLVAMWTTFDNTGDTPFPLSLAEQYDYAEDSRALEAVGGWTPTELTLTGLGPARRIPVVYTWGDLAGVTGTTPALGRLPTAEESSTGAAPVVLVSHSFWQGPLEGDGDVLGRTLTLDERPAEIIGVLPPETTLPDTRPDLWIPHPRSRGDIRDRSGHGLSVLGRRAPGATLEDARRELDEIQDRWHQEWAGQHSPGHPGHDLRMADAHDWYFGDLRSTGILLLAAAGLLLVLACANVASLLLARGEARQGELALRRALGAGRARITGGLLLESMTVAGIGGLLGLGLASLGTWGLLALAPEELPRLEYVGFDLRVAGFALAATFLAGLAFGVLPALRGIRGRITGGRGSTGGDRALSRSLGALVAAQLGLAVVLVSGAWVLARSVSEMLEADSGVTTEGRLTASLSIPAARYPELQDVVAFWDRLQDEVGRIGGATQVAWARQLPLGDGLRREGMRAVGASSDDEALAVADQVVGPGYLEAAGIPILRGRSIQPGDVAGAPRVALINRAAAEAYWPGEDPVGRQVSPLWMPTEYGPWTIVGVAEDVRHEGVRAEPAPELIVPYAQVPPNERSWIRSGNLVVRTAGDPTALASELRAAVERVDPAVPIARIDSWDGVARSALAAERFLARVVLFFALSALALATVGTFGVVSFSTARRTREIGVRVALGARKQRVVREILRRATVLAGSGALLGSCAAWVAAPLLRSFLFGVSPRGPATLFWVPLALTAVALAAAAVPALRAARIEPLAALRDE